jgi:hypothetical protein
MSKSFVDLVAVQEIDPSARPVEIVGPTAMSADGSTIAIAVDHKGADEVFITNSGGTKWSRVGSFPNVNSLALSGSGSTLAIADGGSIVLFSDGKSIEVKPPPVGQPFAQDLTFLSEDGLGAVVDQYVQGAPSDVSTLANVWSYSLKSNSWSLISELATKGEPWFSARTPVLSTDGTQLYYLVLTNEAHAQGLWLWRVARDSQGNFGGPVKLRKIGDSDSVLLAAKDQSTLLWGTTDINGTWHIVVENAGRYQDVGCARSGSLPLNNGDPDLS